MTDSPTLAEQIGLRDGEDMRMRKIREEWGSAIEAQRSFLKMTQRELAERCGVTPQAVSLWEAGKAAPRPHLQLAIAEALSIPHSLLFKVAA